MDDAPTFARTSSARLVAASAARRGADATASSASAGRDGTRPPRDDGPPSKCRGGGGCAAYRESSCQTDDGDARRGDDDDRLRARLRSRDRGTQTAESESRRTQVLPLRPSSPGTGSAGGEEEEEEGGGGAGGAAAAIQRVWRGFRHRGRAARERADIDAAREAERLRRLEEERDSSLRLRLEADRRLRPRRPEDFETLYTELDSWVRDEARRAEAAADVIPEERARLRRGVTEREAMLLRKIESLKAEAAEGRGGAMAGARLARLGEPVRWRLAGGGAAEVDTPYGARARELGGLYNGLAREGEEEDDRIRTLLAVKATVSEVDCLLTRDIRELADREGDLIRRGLLSGDAASGMRTRLLGLFVQFAEAALRCRLSGGGGGAALRDEPSWCDKTRRQLWERSRPPLPVSAGGDDECREGEAEGGEGRTRDVD